MSEETAIDARSAGRVATARKARGGLLHSDYVYKEIRRRILESEFPVGLQLLETDIAALFGVSRTPVRDALGRLERDGLIEVRPRHGMRVLPISTNDMQEIYELLAAIESLAARIAAERGIPAAVMRRLEKAARAMDDAIDASDRPRWFAADEQFHTEIIRASRNSRLIDIATRLLDQSHRSRLATLKLRPRPDNRDHLALLEALSERNAERAAEVHFRHRWRNAKVLIDLLKKHRLEKL